MNADFKKELENWCGKGMQYEVLFEQEHLEAIVLVRYNDNDNRYEIIRMFYIGNQVALSVDGEFEPPFTFEKIANIARLAVTKAI